jgi:dipeptidyl aminopeptidase/acylaminoacyl peptidase
MKSKQIYIILGVALAILAGIFLFRKESPKEAVQEIQNEFTEEGGGGSFHAVSIPALANKQYDGRDLTVGQKLDENSAYTRYFITYMSGSLKISGIMNVPKGTGPFPVLILNHGYIDPAVYTNGRGLKREQDYLTRRGYVVIHSDYRNHAQSDKDPDADVKFRLGYVEDVINVVYAVQNSDLPYFQKDKVGMLGHSMGGGVTQNILVVQPDLVDAAVLFAPVSGNNKNNFDRWLVRRPETAQKIIAAYGTPEDSPDFWHDISMINFLDRIKTPIMLHHGTADESVPLDWSNELSAALQRAGKEITYYTYEGQPHEFTTSWGQVMQRTVDFFDKYLK